MPPANRKDPKRAKSSTSDYSVTEPLSGDVEIDETGVHGRPRGPKMTKKEAAHWRERQVSVLGMVERGGGSSCA